MNLSDSPRRPACSSRASGWSSRTTPWGLPCCVRFPCVHAVATTPAQQLGYCFAHSPSRISLPRKGHRVGLRIVLFEACSAFTRVTACTLALSPIRDTHSEGFSYFVTSIAAPAASGWSVRRVGLAPTGKRRLVTAHTHLRHRMGHARAFQCASLSWYGAEYEGWGSMKRREFIALIGHP